MSQNTALSLSQGTSTLFPGWNGYGLEGSLTLDRDSDQSWYWSEPWQKWEREVEEELATGKYKMFSSGEEFLKSLGDA